MTRDPLDDAEDWHLRYEEAQVRLNQTIEQLAEATHWRDRYEPVVQSRSWKAMEAIHRYKWRLTTAFGRLGTANPAEPAAPSEPKVKPGDGWDYAAAAARHLTMGRHSYFTPNVIVFPGDTAKVVVGNFSSIFYDVDIFVGGDHTIDTVSTFAFRQQWALPGALTDGIPSTKGDVRIGSDVWIGKGATILSGVTIGDGAVVGTRAVVAKDVRPYAIVVGNPAREVKTRFAPAIVEALLRIKWWEWPDAVLETRISEISGGSVESFVERYD